MIHPYESVFNKEVEVIFRISIQRLSFAPKKINRKGYSPPEAKKDGGIRKGKQVFIERAVIRKVRISKYRNDVFNLIPKIIDEEIFRYRGTKRNFSL